MKSFAGIIVAAAISALPLSLTAGHLAGDWSGQLKLSPKQSLKLVLHISGDNVVTMDSPDQGAYGIECQTIFLSDDSINIKIPALRVNYAGGLKGDNIDGIFKQGMMKQPLTLTAGEKKAKRPQTPVAPFPYTTEDVSIYNPAGDCQLAGTLTIPADATKKTPVVVLVSGSGLQNRDEELFEHKPFAVIADYLARNGVASLRYDDRGFGESTGDPSNTTTADFAADAKAVIDWLRDRGGFGKVGIIGHSEGGQIAYILGAQKGRPDFIISIAGPAIKGTRTIAYQNKEALLNSGIPAQQAEDFEIAIEKVLEYKLSLPVLTSVSDELLANLYPQYADDEITSQLAAGIRTVLTSENDNPWYNFFLASDPQKDIKALKLPAMIIYGERDRQVPPSLNADPARSLAPKAKVMVYPDLNHLMQHAVTGNVDEYRTIEETFSPEVLADILGFIKSLN